MERDFSNTNEINLLLMTFPRLSLYCKLVPVKNQEYEYGLLVSPFKELSLSLSLPLSLYRFLAFYCEEKATKYE